MNRGLSVLSVFDCWERRSQFSKLPENPHLHWGSRGMESILMGALWEFVRFYLSPDVVVQLRVTAQCWNIGENCGPFGAFFFFI